MARKRYHNDNDNANNNNNNSDLLLNLQQPPMIGRVVVITGAAGGIGSELTLLFATKLGSTVIALDRNETGLQELIIKQQQKSIFNHNKDDIEDDDRTSTQQQQQQRQGRSGEVGGRIITKVIRQEDLSNVSNIANEIISEYHGKIDLLINNAGLSYPQNDPKTILGSSKIIAADGYDLLFTVNYLSHFLLTEKLLPSIVAKNGRIVHITSTFHWKVDGSELLCCEDDGSSSIPVAYESDPTKQSRYHLERSYANSKLAQIWYSHYMNRCCFSSEEESDITSVCACPTWAATGIAGNDEGRDFLSKYAFSTSNCGPGMTSIINACLKTNEELGDAASSTNSQSFVANCRLLDYFIGKEIWLTLPIWRDNISTIIALILLLFQKYTYSNSDVIIQKTSPESCDIEKQNRFYDWSSKQISKYL